MRRAAGIAALVLAGLGLAPAASAQEQGGPAFSTLPLPAIDPILVDAPGANRILPVLKAEAVPAAAAIQHCSVIDAESTNATTLAAAKEAPHATH